MVNALRVFVSYPHWHEAKRRHIKSHMIRTGYIVHSYK